MPLLLSSLVSGCDASWVSFSRRSAGGTGLLDAGSRQDPALSGNGQWLATVIERNGRLSLLLQHQPDGRVVPLRQIRGHQPHSSPTLSWNGRYVAALVQQGNQRLAVIEDRASGRLHRLTLPGERIPVRLSLAPDGQRLAVELMQEGQRRVELLDLTNLLEPDRPAGQAVGEQGR
ncbi:MAG: Tol biopolymer transporter periplasmic protein [Cyanobacteriota bacterium]|jgi:Tol biopolymer transport system component|nr:Tol biopolymer transporter periplasmic protein [Cyanobacteriota bacterium]